MVMDRNSEGKRIHNKESFKAWVKRNKKKVVFESGNISKIKLIKKLRRVNKLGL